MDYLHACNCKGKRPLALRCSELVRRDSLVARMMENRAKVRYLVAPFGFGKTHLAACYAEALFNFRNTVWIDGASPYFLRDLDDETAFVRITELLPESGLVVIDNALAFSRVRERLLWKLCAALLSQNREVIVTADSCADPLTRWAKQCVTVRAADLLYTQDERYRNGAVNTSGVREKHTHGAYTIPLLALGDETGMKSLLYSFAVDGSIQRALSAFVLLALGSGSLSQAQAVCGCNPVNALSQGDEVALGVDMLREEFAAVHVEPGMLAATFEPFLSQMAAERGLDCGTTLVARIADALGEGGRFERACGLLELLADTASRRRWLVRFGVDMLFAGAIAPAQLLADTLVEAKGQSMECAALEMMRLCLLGSTDNARVCYAHFRDASVEGDRPAELPEEAMTFEERLALIAQLNAHSGAKSLSLMLDEVEADSATMHTAALFATVLFFVSRHANDCDWIAEFRACRMRMEHIATALSIALEHAAQPMVAEWMFWQSMRTITRTVASLNVNQGSACITRCRFIDDAMAVQRSQYARACTRRFGMLTASAGVSNAVAQTHEDACAALGMLQVNLLGGLEVMVGDDAIDPSLLSRQKARALLASLALNKGRQVSCAALAQDLWPQSCPDTARRNFYSISSMLRKALSSASGSCPFLHRSSGVLTLDATSTIVDVDEVEELCRVLRQDGVSPERLRSTLVRLCKVYRGDIMPADCSISFLDAARRRVRDQVVDALIYATDTLRDHEEALLAVSFARQALAIDGCREDAFETLIRCQAFAGQNTAARETIDTYRDHLVSKFGQDAACQADRFRMRMENGDDSMRKAV